MQTTYRIKASEVDQSLLEAIRKNFKGDEPLTITVKSESRESQYQMFLKSEELQRKFPPAQIDPDIDLSALADEINW